MLVSDSRQFIFVHVQKTAGTSIFQALIPYANPGDRSKLGSFLRLFDRPLDYRRYKFRTHAPLREAQRKMPKELFESYFKFAFVRNPWDRLVSEYNAALKKNQRRRHRRIARFHDFEDFIRYELRRRKFFQVPMLQDREGCLGVDFVGRFETLARDFEIVCRRLDLDTELGRYNAFTHGHYREYYTDRTRKLVARGWAKDIEEFGYEF